MKKSLCAFVGLILVPVLSYSDTLVIKDIKTSVVCRNLISIEPYLEIKDVKCQHKIDFTFVVCKQINEQCHSFKGTQHAYMCDQYNKDFPMEITKYLDTNRCITNQTILRDMFEEQKRVLK